MALFEINADLTEAAKQLRRMADALERISPPPRVRGPLPPMKIINVDPADIAEAEEEADRRAQAGTAGAA